MWNNDRKVVWQLGIQESWYESVSHDATQSRPAADEEPTEAVRHRKPSEASTLATVRPAHHAYRTEGVTVRTVKDSRRHHHHKQVIARERSSGPLTPAPSPGSSSRDAVPEAVSSPAIIRHQLVESVLTSLLKESYGNSSVCRSGIYGRDILQNACNPTMQAALDGLCLAHFGTVHFDRVLLGEAQRRRSIAIARLRLDLQKNSQPDEAVLGTVYVLAIQSLYSCLNSGGAKMHLQALQSLMLARGPKGELSRMGKTMLLNLIWLLNKTALRERKDLGLITKSPAWSAHLPVYAVADREINDARFRLPALLEKLDNFTRKGQQCLDTDEVLDLQAEFAEIEKHLHAWLLKTTATNNEIPYRVVSPRFRQKSTSCLAGIPESDTIFTSGLEFASGMQFIIHVRYWTDMLLVKMSLLELGNFSPIMASAALAAFWRTGADECADRLFQSLMWLVQPERGYSKILVVEDMIYFPAMWYGKSGDLRKLNLCRYAWRIVKRNGFDDFYHGKSLEECLTPFVPAGTFARADAMWSLPLRAGT